MRFLLTLLGGLFLLLQWDLWVGEGSLASVARLEAAVAAQRAENQALRARNRALAAEVRDLKQGLDAIEERARGEMGMIRRDEVFIQFVGPHRR